VFSAVSAGAVGYLLKGAAGADIVTAVRAAGAGQAVFGAALTQRLRTWFTRGPQAPAEPFPQVTVREREILDGGAAGLTNAQVWSKPLKRRQLVAIMRGLPSWHYALGSRRPTESCRQNGSA
jgi:hypothetical protein